MQKTGDKPFDKNCKAEMKSLIPMRDDRINCKRANEKVKEADSKTVSKVVRRGAWDAEGQVPEPRISMKNMILLKKVQEEKKHIVDNQHELTRRITLIKEQLTEVKTKIEKITQDQQTIDERIDGCQDCGNLLRLANQKSLEHRHLMRFIEQEEKLMNELSKTQREVCEARVLDQAFSLEMEKEIDSIYDMYHSRKEFLVKRRIRRENIIEKNARAAHKQTLKEVIHSLSRANKVNQAEVHNTKMLNIEVARNKMKKYFRKTLRDREIQVQLQEEDRQAKMMNQKRRLGHLKAELDRQKDVMRLDQQLREKRRIQADAQEEAQRKEMLLAGENPYLQDKMRKSADKSIEIKTKIEKETEEIKQVALRFEQSNLAKEKEEMQKRKWERIWAKRLKEKKERDLKKRKEMYGIPPPGRILVPTAEDKPEELEEQILDEVALSETKQKSKVKVKRKKGKHEKKRSKGKLSDIESKESTHVLKSEVESANSNPDIILLNDSPAIAEYVMDFGAVCLGNHAIQEFKFSNVSSRTLDLKMDIFNPYGPFMQCNALRKIEPNDTYTLRVRFKPSDYNEVSSQPSFKAEECICLFGGDSKIQLTLRGRSVVAQFYVHPLKSEIYIGTIQAQSVGSYQFEVLNPSEGDIPFTLELESIGPFLGKLSSEMNEEDEDAIGDLVPPAPPRTSMESPPNTPASNPAAHISPPVHHRHKKRHSRNKSSGEFGFGEVKHKHRRKSSSHKRRQSSLRSARHSQENPEDFPITPPPFVGPFEIVQDGQSRLLHLREMLEYLEEEKQPVFFQVVPSTFTVKALSTEKFIVYFIPVVPGSYFGGFKVVMFGNVVHEFNVVGVATPMQPFLDEDVEDA